MATGASWTLARALRRSSPALSGTRSGPTLTRARHLLPLLVALATVGLVRPAQAQERDDEGFGADVEVARPMARTNELDATASGTAVSGLDRPEAATTAAELLREVPGVDVAETGAEGAFAGLRLRGAEMGHTALYIGDVPFGGPESGLIDLSLLPTTSFERFEVYRGGAPTWLGAGAIGGVLRLVPRQSLGRVVRASLDYGSFGTWRADLETQVSGETRHGDVGVVALVGARGTAGDYPFLDDRGTRLDPQDDVETLRQNADQRGGHGMVRFRYDTDLGEFSAILFATGRQGGEPGIGNRFARFTRQSQSQLYGTLAWQREWERARLQVVFAGGTRRDRFLDRFGEIGLGLQDTDDRVSTASLRVASEVALLSWLDLQTVAVASWERYAPENLLGYDAVDGERLGVVGAAELRAHGQVGPVRMELRGSARVEHSDTDAAEIVYSMEVPRQEARTVPTFRGAFAVAPTHWLTFRGSVSSGARLPTFLELFGNRGTLEANEGLLPESSLTGSGGVVMQGEIGWLRAELEAEVFHLAFDELIRYVPRSQFTARAINSSGGRATGFESGARLDLGEHLGLSGSFTWMDTDNGQGRELNWRPRMQAFARPELRSGALRVGSTPIFEDIVLYGTAHHRGAYFHDGANRVEVPGRTWLGVGMELRTVWGVRLRGSLRDVLDQRGQDFVGYPLPGRRWALSIEYRSEY